MKRIEHFKKQLQGAKTDAEFMTALIVLLMAYSQNLISRMTGDAKTIREWLEGSVR